MPSSSSGPKMLLGVGSQAQDTELRVQDVTFAEFIEKLRVPKIGQKNGWYVLRGGKMKENRRADENLLEAELLVIDGDSRFDPQTGEIISGAPDFDLASDTLRKLGVAFVMHTTHSNGPGKPKWRAYIPAHMTSPEQLEPCVTALVEQMNALGCYVTQTKECSTWSQAWFTPRVPSEEAMRWFRHDFVDNGVAFDVAAAVAGHSARQAAEETIRKAQAAPATPKTEQGDSTIKAFNRDSSLAWVRETLESQGYKFAYKRGDTFRYISPTSETGTPGVVVFKGAEGDWCCYSHHGAHDPLSGKLTDPFGLFALFQHGGDVKRASRELWEAAGGKSRSAGADHFAGYEADADPFEKARRTEREPPDPSRFQWITKENGTAPVLNGNWLIKKVLPAEGLGVIFGRPGSGKTFTVMDLAMHIAAGLPWRGIKTRRAPVSYISPEAGRLGVNRVLGWCQYHEQAWPGSFRLSPAAINLCSDAADADALIADVRANQPGCQLVVIDTLNRAMAGGDENSGEDMGRFVQLCDKIAKELSAFVLVVHHSGKDAAKGSRGHSSLLGAVSLELEVTKQQGEPGSVRVSKMRDGEDGAEYGFDIDSVPLGVDEDGDEVTTGISVEADVGEVKAARQAAPTGKNQKLLADAFSQFVDDHGRPNPTGVGMPEAGTVRVVDAERFIDFAAGKMPGRKPHEARKLLRMAVESMTQNHYFAINGGMLWRL